LQKIALILTQKVISAIFISTRIRTEELRLKQQDLLEIATQNITSYSTRFNKRPIDEQKKISDVKSDLNAGINLGTEALLKTISDKYKNRFEICAENEGMTLDEFSSLSLEKQIELICKDMSDKNRIFGSRRVAFSNKYLNGLKLYYLAPNMGISVGNQKYGKFCVIIRLSSDNDVALKHDSLHYFNEENEFNQTECEKDLIPYSKIELLLSDKFLKNINKKSVEELKSDTEQSSLEILTAQTIKKSNIIMVLTSFEHYRYIEVELNIKKAKGESLTAKEEEIYQNFYRLKRTGIKIISK